MSRDKIQPSEKLIERARVIADIKDGLPFCYRGLLNIQDVYYQARTLRNRSLFYMAGGR